MQPFNLEAGGIELCSKVPIFSGDSGNGLGSDAETDATSGGLAKLIELWPELSSDMQTQILRLANQARATVE